MNINLLQNKRSVSETDSFLANLIESQKNFENGIKKELKKANGVFFTNKLKTVDDILDIIKIDESLLGKKILDPSCGQGIFLLRLLANIYHKYPSQDFIFDFIKNNLIFVDIDSNMINTTKNNISNFFGFLFDESYRGDFNEFEHNFTQKIINPQPTLFQPTICQHPLKSFLDNVDYVIGNPPYVTLYGRRDKKQSEHQRIYYLNNYIQFPPSVKNGKINYIMLFLEHSLEFMRKGALLSFIIDISFFETAFLYTRKFLLKNTKIISLDINVSDFEVASGQLILKLQKGCDDGNNLVQINNRKIGDFFTIKQSAWDNPDDEYRFRINHCSKTEQIIYKIESKKDKNLKQLYPKKNLRTCVMLLDLEDKFVSTANNLRCDIKTYPYYEGSKSLDRKYGDLKYGKYFYYDKKLQDKINEALKIELERKGIKNKKRIGFGETVIYDNPKVFIRQSAKEIIATYSEEPGSANNSLYVFSLRDCARESKIFLKFLCGLLNSKLITFYAQTKNIIRYSTGKQPQIKISDLYSIRIPQGLLQGKIVNLVEKIYSAQNGIDIYSQKVDDLIFGYYSLTKGEIDVVEETIKSF